MIGGGGDDGNAHFGQLTNYKRGDNRPGAKFGPRANRRGWQGRQAYSNQGSP